LLIFQKEPKASEKIKFANEILEKIFYQTVLEKSGKFSGRLRKMETKHIAGERNKEVLYKEKTALLGLIR